MCGPEAMFATQAAMQIGGAVLGSSSDSSDYHRKRRALADEADAIRKSTIFRYSLSSLQQQQIQDRANIEAGDARLRLAEATGTAKAAAASGGVEGNSVDALVRSFEVATGSDISDIYAQRDNEVAQSRAEQKGFHMEATNRLTAVRNQMPEDPGTKMLGRFLGAALGIGDSFLKNTTSVDRSKGEKGGIFGRKFG